MPPKIRFADNPDRIPSPWCDDVEQGIRQSLVERPAAESWEITHSLPPGRDVYVVSFQEGKRKVGLWEFHTEMAATQDARKGESESEKMQRLVKGWARDLLGKKGH